MVTADGASRLGSPHYEAGKSMARGRRRGRDRPAQARLLQPALARPASSRRGSAGRRLRPDRALPGRPPDDQPGRGPRRRPDGPHRADLPAVGQGQDRLRRDRRLRDRGARAHRAAGRGAAASGSSTSSASSAAPRRSRASTPRDFEERELARRRLAFDELLRLQLVLVMKKRAAATAGPGIAHVVTTATGPGGPRRRSFLGRLPFELTAAQRTCDRGGRRRSRRVRTRCTASCRATSARARRSSPWRRSSTASRAATRARSWSRPRCSPSSTTSPRGRFLAGLAVPDPHAPRRDASAGGGAADEPDDRRRAGEDPVRARRPGASTSSWARTPC